MLVTLVAALSLHVPFLPQTEALCGGAAVSMVFRYWGDAHADAGQFAALVDRRAGGIADDVLVGAVSQRGWQAARLVGSIETLEAQLSAGRPIVILVADRRSRYHYLVVTGIEDAHVVVHDPAWGPSRRMPKTELLRVWQPTNYWALRILPAELPVKAAATPPIAPERPANACERMTLDAVDAVGQAGLSATEARLAVLSARCPDSAAPLRELAGIRFAQRQWPEAADLAQRAAALDDKDAYAWDVLGSSRFMQNDVSGALDAWNHIARPRVDSVHIEGLQHGRYQTITEFLGLQTGAVITDAAFRLAERRLQALPDRGMSRITLRPGADGYAVVDVALRERSAAPRAPLEWAGAVARAASEREARLALPGFTGQGELWSAGWRWWRDRPRVELGFAAPRVGPLPGVWRFDANWEAQTYAFENGGSPVPPVRQSRTHGGITVSDWLTPDVRYSVSAGLDAWTDLVTRRTASIGGGLERRWLRDRLSAAADLTTWLPLGSGRVFRSVGSHAAFRSSTTSEGWTLLAGAGIDHVSDLAPVALWRGAGAGHARPALLRAHRLLRGGTIDASERAAFGRRLLHSNVEIQRWLETTAPVRVGFATFADAARAARRSASRSGPVHIDVGAGLRLRMPGAPGALRIDVAHGIRDGANALSIGWQY